MKQWQMAIFARFLCRIRVANFKILVLFGYCLIGSVSVLLLSPSLIAPWRWWCEFTVHLCVCAIRAFVLCPPSDYYTWNYSLLVGFNSYFRLFWMTTTSPMIDNKCDYSWLKIYIRIFMMLKYCYKVIREL